MKERHQKAIERQQKSIEEEIQKAGLQLTKSELFIQEEAKLAGEVVDAMKLLFTGGKIRSNAHQEFQFTGNGQKFMYFQPYSGVNPMPGEYHTILKANANSPFIYKKALFGGKWHSGNAQLEKELNSNKELKKVTKKVKWQWMAGTARFKLDWIVKVEPLDNGILHLVMVPGRYGGLTTYKVGVSVFANVVEAIKQFLSQNDTSGEVDHEKNRKLAQQSTFGKVFLTHEFKA